MALIKRGETWHISFTPFGKQVSVSTGTGSKRAAGEIEALVLAACRSGDYRMLQAHPLASQTCVRMFINKRWTLPPELGGHIAQPEPIKELTLWDACREFMQSPIGLYFNEKSAIRHRGTLPHVVEFFGKKRTLSSIKAPDIRKYQQWRVNQGATPASANREMSSLSRLFEAMREAEKIERNPVREVKKLSEKGGQRQVYLGRDLIESIAAECPEWFRRIVWASYMTGMRRGELVGLRRKDINLGKRIITLTPAATKEAQWKRVPIHLDLVPILEQAIRTPYLGSDHVFLIQDAKGIRPLGTGTYENPWKRATARMKLPDPKPRFHDLRHTWKTNARRSGMDAEIREAILGHAQRGLSVSERYGRIGDNELIREIDKVTWDHGETEILVAGYAMSGK